MATQDKNGRVETLNDDNYMGYDMFKEERPNSSFQKEAIRGIHQDNELAQLFFSVENLNALQQGIRYLVYKRTCGKHTIGKQSDTELQIIMRSVYLEHGRYKQYKVLEEVKRLNTIVLNYCVPKIVEELNIYMHYRKDIAQLPVPMDRGQFVSSKGTRVLETRDL
jgi:hypothetical protein